MSDYRPRFRLWVRDADRRPDPPVKHTDDRTPVLIGTIIWVVALVIVLLAPSMPGAEPWRDADRLPYAITSAVGLVLGPLGLIYFKFRRR